MRVLEPDKVEPEALKVNKKSLDEVMAAPHPEEVWAKFASWVGTWNWKGKNDGYSAPIPAGHNILRFDLPILQRYAAKYGTQRYNKRMRMWEQSIFSTFVAYDTLNELQMWTENLPEFRSVSLDSLRRHFAMPNDTDRETHDALRDVRDTAKILVKLIGLKRKAAPKVIWKDCFDPEKVEAEVQRRKAVKEKKK